MSNLRLKDHTWDAANVYDSALGKTQEQINAEVGTSLAGKQGTLVSGENIKTVNGASILGSGNIEIQGGGTGEDGYSPVVTISNITGGHRVNITDKTHQQGQNFDVMDGADGTNGTNGVSPSVVIADISGGHRVTITDASGAHTFDVMDGDPAPASEVVPAVESWLTDNITQETGYVIDDSLTVTGAAADAKKLGDEIGGLESEKANYINIATIEYQTNRRYTADEYCVYDGDVYVCTENITEFEAWTPAHWRKIKITDELPTGAFDDYLITGVSGGIADDGTSASSSSRSRTLYMRANKGDVLILPVNEEIRFSIFQYELNPDGVSYTFIEKANAAGSWDKRTSRYIVPYDCYVRVLEQVPVASFVPILLRRSVPGISLQKMKEESFDMLLDKDRAIGYQVSNVDGTISADSTGNRKSSRLISMNTGDIMYCDTDKYIALMIYDVTGEFLYQYSPGWARYNDYTFFKADKPMFIRLMEQTTDSEHTWSNCHIIRNLNQKVHEINWKNNKFLDISHQGFRDEAPSSTVAAYVRAKAKGCNAMEGDIRFTSDGIAVISHGDTMPSDSTYAIASHTLAELRANANMGSYRGEPQPIMTFEEWLVLSIELDMTPIIEFKADPSSSQVADLVNMCVHKGLIDRLYWMVSTSSASAVYAQTFLNVNSRCRLAFINTTTVSDIAPYVDSNNPSKVIIYTRTENVTSALMTAASEANIPVMAWAVTFTWQYPDFTTKQVIDEILRVIDLGVAGICLDNWTASEIIRLKYIKYLDYDSMSVQPE